MNYINKFDTATEALESTSLIAPQVVYVEDEDKILYSGSEYALNTKLEIKRIGSELSISQKLYKGLSFKCYGLGTISCTINGTYDMKYSLDNGDTWIQWDLSRIPVSNGDIVCFKGNNPNGFSNGLNFTFSNIEGHALTSVEAYGNIMSLIDDGACNTLVIPCDGCFRNMFKTATKLTRAPELPATTLKQYCYGGMFKGCSSLTTAPELPATTLADYCYTTPPWFGYEGMFSGCSSLNYIKCLATDISATDPTYNWLASVASTGTFVKAAGAEWPTGSSGIPSGWTVQDDEVTGTSPTPSGGASQGNAR